MLQLLANTTDVAFVGANVFYGMNLTLQQRSSLRIIDPIIDAKYPYECSTPKLPTALMFSNPAVSNDVRTAMQNALLSIAPGGAQATAGGYYRWILPLSTSILMDGVLPFSLNSANKIS